MGENLKTHRMRNSELSLEAFGPIRDIVIFLLSSAHGIGFLLSRGQGTKHLASVLDFWLDFWLIFVVLDLGILAV